MSRGMGGARRQRFRRAFLLRTYRFTAANEGPAEEYRTDGHTVYRRTPRGQLITVPPGTRDYGKVVQAWIFEAQEIAMEAGKTVPSRVAFPSGWIRQPR